MLRLLKRAKADTKTLKLVLKTPLFRRLLNDLIFLVPRLFYTF